MRTVGFTAADIAANEAKTDSAVKIGRVAVDDINRINDEEDSGNAAPPEKPKNSGKRKAKSKASDSEYNENDGADEEPVTDENGETENADSNS